MAQPSYHGWTHKLRLLGGTDPPTPSGFYEIKVFADANATDGTLPASATDVSVGDGKFIFAIPEDLHDTSLVRAFAFVTTVGSGNIIVQIRNITNAVDMLSTRITIGTGEFTSYTFATPPVVNAANALVAMADLIAVDVDADGTGDAKGLGVGLLFALI